MPDVRERPRVAAMTPPISCVSSHAPLLFAKAPGKRCKFISKSNSARPFSQTACEPTLSYRANLMFLARQD